MLDYVENNKKYYIPESVEELFDNGNESYTIIDYEIDAMDNIASMEFFLDAININEDNIELLDGTQAYLKHEAYPYTIRIDAGGLGDFYSHRFEVKKIFKIKKTKLWKK